MPPPAPPTAAPVHPEPAGPPQSGESRAAEAYYTRVQADLLARGLMRTDGGGPDVPFSQRQLVENFVQIALYDEYDMSGSSIIARKTESRLRRWLAPVRVDLIFGDSVPAAQRQKDRANVAGYIRRLSRISGHPIHMASADNANFHVMMLREDERHAIGPQLRALVPGIDQLLVRTIVNLPRSTFCTVFAFSRDGTSNYSQAIAVIRAEQPDALRLSCIHEELAQGMGLANDSPAARPSIFNDDEEFALLTNQDELMLKMLYDPRLRPGMKADEVRPILRIIAAELMGGES